MSNWKYIDEYESLPDSDFIHCDTRDFHILCVDNEENRKETNLEIQQFVIPSMFPDCLFTKDEILKILKDLEIRSGGKGEWRMLSIGDIDWLKYIRFIKWNDKYLAYGRKYKILSHKLLEETPIDKEHLN